MMFPHSHEERIPGMIPARICPDCLQVKLGEEGTDECAGCGAEMVDVLIPNPIRTSGTKDHKQYVCPYCGSRRGLSLMGLRSATEISASISQMFASRFNDDKKTLAFLIMFRMLHIGPVSSIPEHGASDCEPLFRNTALNLAPVRT